MTCYRCKCRETIKGRKKCERCLDQLLRNYHKERRELLLKNGLCAQCGATEKLPNRRFCATCHHKITTHQRNAYRIKHNIPLDAPLWGWRNL